MKASHIALLCSTAAAGLMAGLFYAFSCSVSAGLGKLADAEYLRAMQSINREIQGPLFFAPFFGLLVLLPLTTWLHAGPPGTFALCCVATAVYFIAVFGVTVFGNVPLNERLDGVQLSSAGADSLAALRAAFERRWNVWNHIRTGGAVLTLLCLIAACLQQQGRGIRQP